eukprot:CAMPEP_0194126274 /NCGR_PEP_ID=MMETSP0150-20130528/59904_1 /TAXON_ID=122233 /ORGANISM="Chaetoceros debilis, Strain MM31A-1" /LENGTH=1236 /DNA_ID=CAMNT_0038820127 /DNA_START=46 /DNA_END=3756 /DNA_ORIENTATION=-
MTTASSDRAVRLMHHRLEFSISPPTIARSDTDPFAFDAANFLWGDSSQQSQSLYESLCESQSQTQSQPMSQGFVHQVSGYTSRTNTNTISSSSNASWNTNLTSNLSNLTSSIIAGSGASSIDTISGGSSTGPGPGTSSSSSLGSGTGLGSAGNSPTRYNAHPNPNANPNAIIGAGHSRSAFSSRLPNVSDGPNIGGTGTGGGQIPAFTSLVVPQEHQEQQRRQQQHQQQHQHQPQQASNYTAPPWQRGYSYGHPYSLPNVNARNINVNENAIRGQNITLGSTTGSSPSTLNHRMPPPYSPWEQQQQQHQQQSESIFSTESRDGNVNANVNVDIHIDSNIAAATEAARRSLVPPYNTNASSWSSSANHARANANASAIHPAPTSSTTRPGAVWQNSSLGTVRGRGRAGGRGRSGSFSRRHHHHHHQQQQHFFTPLPGSGSGSGSEYGLDTTEEDAKVSSFYSNPISPQDVVSQTQYPYSQQQQQQQMMMTSRISLPLGLNSPRMAIDSTPSRYFLQAATRTSNTTSSNAAAAATVPRPSSTATIETMGSIDESVTSSTFGSSRRPSLSSGGSRKFKSSSRRRASISPATTPRGYSSFSKKGDDIMEGTEFCTLVGTSGVGGGGGEPSPPAQNLRGDPFRSAKVKTELCRNFNTRRGCQFGDKCNYAHGAQELKLTKLMDLERAGLVDIEIFRTHPCLTWVATGACPFDTRCIGLHDPRVTSDDHEMAWLPHAETMINKVTDGANVDKFYHERLTSAYNSFPLYGYVPLVRKDRGINLEDDASWEDFYNHVCNSWRMEKQHSTPVAAASWEDFYNHVCNSWRMEKQHSTPVAARGVDSPSNASLEYLSEADTLEIVLNMRKDKLGTSFAYSPTHLLHGDLCMVLQSKSFQLQSGLDASSRPSTVLKEVTDQNEGGIHFKVYEIAFGPIGDPTVRTLSIYFDIPTSDLCKCTPQQAKHHKRSRHRLKSSKRSLQSADDYLTVVPPFDDHQPLDEATFDLITNILALRLKMVRLFSGGYDFGVVHAAKEHLEISANTLKQSYFSLLRFWVTWSWPEQVLQRPINSDTDVPPVETHYDCNIHDVKYIRTKECYGLGTRRYEFKMTPITKHLPSFLWKSYLINVQLARGKSIEEVKTLSPTVDDDTFSRLERLRVFRDLSLGKETFSDRTLNHFKIGRITLDRTASVHTLIQSWDSVWDHYSPKQSNRSSRSDNLSSNSVLNQEDELTRHLDRCAMDTNRTL